jgi:molybdate transport system permease protein
VSGAPCGHLPRSLAIPAAIGLAFLLLPLLALVARVDWSTFASDITSPAALSALTLSLGTGAVATAVCVVVGVPLALLIARAAARTAAVLRALVTVPLVLPPMVGGVALLYLFGRNGVLGDALGMVGVRVPFTTAAVVMAQVFVALPFGIYPDRAVGGDRDYRDPHCVAAPRGPTGS